MALLPAGGHGPHAAGIFADMTVDGPEIGTLVLVIDRAKNLPNRRSMGKQSAYCAARVGKEAKKTETDKRGGQTPKWDQELRFTIHDSPDYQQFKLSVFSEEKKTDLIGEAWVSLTEVVVPGGGRNDLWQGLNCKGKYAGEIRIELTYYDSRPKPEKAEKMSREVSGVEDDMRSNVGGTRVKRRPLPTNPNASSMTPDAIADLSIANPGRAKHGPRDLRAPGRSNSSPPEQTAPPPMPQPAMPYDANSYGSSMSMPLSQSPPDQYQDEMQLPQSYPAEQPYQDLYQQPDFLPQLPPSNRQRSAAHQRVGSRQAQSTQPSPLHPRPQSAAQSTQPSPIYSRPQSSAQPAQPSPLQPRPHIHGLPHSHSAPIVPSLPSQHNRDPHPAPLIPAQSRGQEVYDHGYELSTDYPEPIPDLDYQHQQLRQRRIDVPPGWQEEYGDPYGDRPMSSGSDLNEPPPPPPMHSNSAPVVPQYTPSHHSSPASGYGGTPHNTRHNSVPNASPLQQAERRYAPSQHSPSPSYPSRGRSMDMYNSSPEHSPYGAPPPSASAGHSPSPYGRSPAHRTRHSVADPYMATPTRPHPLSQEVPRPRSRSPMPYAPAPQTYAQPRSRSPLPPGHPRAPSPNPYPQPRSRSPMPYDPRAPSPQPYAPPQYQQQGYHDGSPAPIVRPRAVSPRPPGPVDNRPRSSYSLQYPVRAFESSDGSPLSTSLPRGIPPLNTNTPVRKPTSAQPSPLDLSHSARASPGAMPFSPDSFDVHRPSPSPAYPANSGGGGVFARDDPAAPIVGWHGQEIDPSDHLPVDSWAPEPAKKTPTKTYGLGRERDFGPRNAQATPPGSAGGGRSLGRDNVITVRMKGATASSNPVESEGSPGAGGRNRLTKRNTGTRSPGVQPLQERHNFNAAASVPDPYAQGGHYSSGFMEGRPGYGGQQAPNLPPKVPLGNGGNSYAAYAPGDDALAREIGSIDIGGSGSRAGRSPAPVAYVPVRSHRERGSYY